MSDEQITFNLKLPNDEVILLPPKSTTKISDVYKHVQKYTNDDLILYYKNIPIPKNNDVNLTDIGYDPFVPLYMKHYETKECYFKIFKNKYSFSKQFQSYQTIFDIKTFFAEEFHTIAQNIVVKNNTEIIQDNSIAIDKSNYEIDVIEGYSLFYVFLYNFFFICLPKNSTFKDLKIAISGYHYILSTRIKFGPILDELLSSVSNSDELLIQDYSSKVNVFDFQYEIDKPDINNIQIKIESDKGQILYQYNGPFPYHKNKMQPKFVVETIKYFLENRTHINNDAFLYCDDSKHQNMFSFCSVKKFYVSIENSKRVFLYLITVKELKEMFCSKDNNVGLVINNRFVFKDSDFVSQFLSFPNSEDSPLQINLIKPDIKCRLCKIQSGHNNKIHTFIVPTFYTFNKISTIYYGKNSNSIQFFNGFDSGQSSSNSPLDNTSQLSHINSDQFHLALINEINIKYHLNGDKKEYSIKMKNEQNPQIKDILFEISKIHNKPYHVYDAYFKGNRVDFWEFAIEFNDQVLDIKTYEYQNKYINVFDVFSNIYIRFKIEEREVTAEQIINGIIETENSHNFSLYLNFHKLAPTDQPIILYQPYDFLFLNKNIPEQKFTISNGHGIEIKKSISFEFNQFLSACIINDFNLIEYDAKFILKIPNSCTIKQKEFVLPPSFDSGCFPKDSIIFVDYKTQETNKLFFKYDDMTETKITLSNSNESIKNLKKEIIEKVKIFNVSQKVVNFEFNGVTLDQNKTFSSYGIIDNSVINITHKKSRIKVEIRLFNETKLGDYFFKPEKETVKDVINQLKLEYGINDPDYELKIYNKPNKNSLLDETKFLEDDEILYASFDKVKIKLLDPKGQRIEFDEILKPTNQFIITELLPKIPEEDKRSPKSAYVLYSRQNCGHYVAIDNTKTFKEIGNRQFFLFRKLTDIVFYFNDKEIKLSDEFKISEFESVGSIINNYLSSIILAPPQSIKLTINDIEVNNNMELSEVISKGKKIIINLCNLVEKCEPKKINKSKVKISAFKPKITSFKLSIAKENHEGSDEEKNESVKTASDDDDEAINKKCKDDEIKDTAKNFEKNDEDQEKNESLKTANDDDEIKDTAINEKKSFFIDNEEEKFHKVINRIGEGASSFTYKIIDERTNQIMCKKVFKINENNTFKSASNALKEFDVMRLINHPCICKVIGINLEEKIKNDMNEDTTTFALFLELLDHKLDEYLEKNPQNYTMKTKIVVEIAHGMSCLHKNHIIHRDLKIGNIMLDSNYNAKVVDFGLVKFSESLSKSEMSFAGTESFMSPEMANEDDYNEKTDVYSFGIVLYYIFIGSLPKQKKKDKLNGIPIPLPKPSDSISQVCLDLISKCLSYNKDDRPSFDEILSFLRDNSYSLSSNIDKKFIKKRDNEIEHIDQKLVELEEEEEENDDDKCTYTFNIKGKEKFEIYFNKDATVKNALKVIAERENVSINDVSIIFGGRKLRRAQIFAEMNITKEDILDVIISEPNDILLKTAKALKIIPSDLGNDDDDYEYEYEYEEEEDNDDE